MIDFIYFLCYNNNKSQVSFKGKALDDNINIEVLEASADKPKRRGGHRPGAGRPALVRLNKERMAQGLEPIEKKKPTIRKKAKSNAILPQNKKARAQEVLAEMLGRKSKYIVQKVLDKALDDDDEDQMACLKLVMDRVLPADYLAKAKGKSNAISITITGVGETTVIGQEVEDEYIDAEIIEEEDA